MKSGLAENSTVLPHFSGPQRDTVSTEDLVAQEKSLGLPRAKIFRAWSDCMVELCSRQEVGKGQHLVLWRTMKISFLLILI